MKVKEMIEILSKLDQEKEICFENNDYEYGTSICNIDFIKHYNEYENDRFDYHYDVDEKIHDYYVIT